MLSIRQLSIEAARAIRFGIVGIAATLIYAGVAALVVETGVGGPLAAAIVGQLAAGCLSYVGHMRFSFRVDPDHQMFFRRFLFIAAIVFVLNVCVTWLLTSALGMSYRVAIAVVSVLIPITNYLCNRFWVFHPGLEPLSKARRI